VSALNLECLLYGIGKKEKRNFVQMVPDQITNTQISVIFQACYKIFSIVFVELHHSLPQNTNKLSFLGSLHAARN
jgi:hypothetical protein